MHKFRFVFWIWLFLYPVLPTGPTVALIIAWLVGRPFIVGFDINGWPVLGPITPSFVFVTIVVPWMVGAAVIYLLTMVRADSRNPHRDAQDS